MFVSLIQGTPVEPGRMRRRFTGGFLLLLIASAAWAQTESQIESDEVRRVGSHLTCQCGCKDNLNCMMSDGQCPFCKPARTKIFRMQEAGMSDSAIVASFLKDFGGKMFRPDPGSSFWLVPYLSFGASGLLIAVILMRMRLSSGKHSSHSSIPMLAAAVSAGFSGSAASSFSRYREEIEKATAELN